MATKAALFPVRTFVSEDLFLFPTILIPFLCYCSFLRLVTFSFKYPVIFFFLRSVPFCHFFTSCRSSSFPLCFDGALIPLRRPPSRPPLSSLLVSFTRPSCPSLFISLRYAFSLYRDSPFPPPYALFFFLVSFLCGLSFFLLFVHSVFPTLHRSLLNRLLHWACFACQSRLFFTALPYFPLSLSSLHVRPTF